MEFTAKQIAEFIQGSVEGNENASVHTFAKIEEGVPGAISFLSNPKYTHYLYDTQSSIVLVDRNLELEKGTQATLIRVDNAYEAVAKLLALYEMSKPKKKGIDSLAYIAPTAQIDEDCYIAPLLISVKTCISVKVHKYIPIPPCTIMLRLAKTVYCIPTFRYITIVKSAIASFCMQAA